MGSAVAAAAVTAPFASYGAGYHQVAPPSAGEVYNQYNYYHQTPASYSSATATASAAYPAANTNYWSGEYATQYYGYPNADYYSAAGDASQVINHRDCGQWSLRIDCCNL